MPQFKGDMDTKSLSETSSDTGSTSQSSDDLKKDARPGWKGKMDFMLTCIGYAVGLGNIWRFPYLCYRSGGGAFFIPYIIFLCLCGVPLFFLETSYGQFSSSSPIAVWKMSPLFKGVGIGMVIVSAIVCVYYNVIIAWTIYYLVMSLRALLPWSNCDNDWNTDACVDSIRGNNSIWDEASSNVTVFVGNLTSFMHEEAASYQLNSSTNLSHPLPKPVSASEEFWNRHVLEVTDGIEELGTIRWPLLLCLAFSWILVFLCLFKGVKVLGKVMHFAAPFPYLVLLVLLIRGVTLPGAIDGIKFYIIPKWDKLLDFKVWGDAALQIFYSVGMGWGGIITMASYNDFNHNIYRDAMIVPFINCGTSIFAGFVIFSVLGFMAYETGTTVDMVATQGPGLTFVVYPEAVAKLPISPLWSVLFFLMLFTIGLDSQFGMFETCLSALMDEYPKYLMNKRTLVAGVVCFIEFLLGLPCITQGGIYVLQIMDWYCASFSLMIISLTECLAIAWVYGADRFYKDIALMIGYEPNIWWKISWKFITPAVILFVWVFSVSQLGPVTYGDKEYPHGAIVIGWILGFISIVPIPTCIIIQFLRTEGSFLQRWNILKKPLDSWGPRNAVKREEYLQSLKDGIHCVNHDLMVVKVNSDNDVECPPPEYSSLLPQTQTEKSESV